MDRFLVWLRNASMVHHRVMAKFLRSRGWVVFYLEERARVCDQGNCWLKLYQSEEARGMLRT